MPRLVKNVSVIDGHAVRVDVELIPEQASPDFSDLYLGAGKDLDAASFWSGLIDDVRIYDRAVMP